MLPHRRGGRLVGEQYQSIVSRAPGQLLEALGVFEQIDTQVSGSRHHYRRLSSPERSADS
jgi:hypothetical protein